MCLTVLSALQQFPTSGEDLMTQIHDQLASSYTARSSLCDSNWELDLLDEDSYLDESIIDTALSMPDLLPLRDGLAFPSLAVDTNCLAVVSTSDSGGAPTPTRKRSRQTLSTALEPSANAVREQDAVTEVKSMFVSGKSVEITSEVNFEMDCKPLQQATHIEYNGTFTVYLDASDKMCRAEFIYTTPPELASGPSGSEQKASVKVETAAEE
jgi:hypothetical protein